MEFTINRLNLYTNTKFVLKKKEKSCHQKNKKKDINKHAKAYIIYRPTHKMYPATQ